MFHQVQADQEERLSPSLSGVTRCLHADAAATLSQCGPDRYEVAVALLWRGSAAYRIAGTLCDEYSAIERTVLPAEECEAFLQQYGFSKREAWNVHPQQDHAAIFAVVLTETGAALAAPSLLLEYYAGGVIAITDQGCWIRLPGAQEYYRIGQRYVCVPTLIDARRLLDTIMAHREEQETSRLEHVLWVQTIHILCPIAQVEERVATLKQELANRATTVSRIEWGMTSKRKLGSIVLQWEGEIDRVFLRWLCADPDIVDVCIYDGPCVVPMNSSIGVSLACS